MDYEKKYKEALERAKSKIKNDKDHVLYEDDVIEIFPELKESDDDRIRKELTQNLKERFGTRGSMGGNLDMPRVLAWLEKQGEKKPTIEMKSAEENLGIDSETYNKVVDECIYGEQNPTWSEDDEEMLRRYISAAFGHGYLKECDWLKSLKPRNRWKPSDEQMKCLSDVVHKAKYNNDISVGGYSAYMPLASLYLDLKKLKE